MLTISTPLAKEARTLVLNTVLAADKISNGIEASPEDRAVDFNITKYFADLDLKLEQTCDYDPALSQCLTEHTHQLWMALCPVFTPRERLVRVARAFAAFEETLARRAAR